MTAAQRVDPPVTGRIRSPHTRFTAAPTREIEQPATTGTIEADDNKDMDMDMDHLTHHRDLNVCRSHAQQDTRTAPTPHNEG